MVPTLVDNGTVIIESTVINEYLDDAYPEPRLKPADAAERARVRLWTKQLDEGVHAATSVVSSAIAFRYQNLAIGMEALEEFHKKMPDAVKREKSWENVTKGVESRFFPEAIKRFDKLLGDMETTLANSSWLAGKEFSLADSASRPTSPGSITYSYSFSGTSGRIFSEWYDRLRERKGYTEALEKWFNAITCR